jgi:hypothetical protein
MFAHNRAGHVSINPKFTKLHVGETLKILLQIGVQEDEAARAGKFNHGWTRMNTDGHG